MKSNESQATLEEENTHLKTKSLEMEARISSLQQQVDWFKRQIFGRKSEKQIIDESHQPMLTGLSGLPLPTLPQKSETDIKAHKRKSNKALTGQEVNDTGLRFDDNVPQKIIDVPAPELSGEDADQYEIIDYKETVRLAQQPGSYTVLIYRHPVLRFKQETISVTPAPTNVLEGCYADVSLLAGLMVDKGVYHLPLYRQHQRMLDSGVQVSRSTLINWMQKGIELLRPIYQAQWKRVLQSAVLAMDEVPIKAGRKSKGKMKQTYYWPIYGENDEVVFTWSASRGHLHAVEQLAGFSGTLLTDGYAAYEKAIAKLNEKDAGIIHAPCWAHRRRGIEKALKMEPEHAQSGIDQIAALYVVETYIRDNNLNAEETLAYRQKYSEPIVSQFYGWVYDQRQRTDLLPQNPLAKALNYISERQAELKVFLTNPNVPIDTNHLERALRVIPMGRKNYLFCWTELGAEQLGILQSLMVTCRLQGINPYTYLVDVLQRVGMHPASDVEDLTPRMWKTKFADNFLTSDLAG